MHEIHPYRKAHPHSKVLTITSIVYLAFVVLLFLVIGNATDAHPSKVLIGFLPALALGVVMILLIETDHFMPIYNYLVMVGILVIASIVYFTVPAAAGLDAGTVLAMNTILMAVFLVILHSSYAHEQPVVSKHAPVVHTGKPVEHTVVHHVHHVEQPKEIIDVIHSVEDKVKALNFVIGRVYSVYHGGTEQLRNKIRVDKTWYDTFNQIDEHDVIKRKHEAAILVRKIKERLDLLQRTERDVFGDDALKLKNITHDAQGKDKIIDVLVRNDKDPVLQYYDGARTFCEQALKELH